MGKRSRKRGDAPMSSSKAGSTRAERDEARRMRASQTAQADPASSPVPGSRSAARRRGERPPPPWGSFPLTELTVFIALILGVIGLLFSSGDRQRTLIVGAMVLGSLGGLEISIRDHFAGFRSHTTLLAGAATMGTVLVIFVAVDKIPAYVPLAVGGLVFAGSFFALREVFKRRSGGLGFR